MIIDFRFLGQNGSQGGGMTSGDVQSMIESYNYVDSGEVETQITEKGYLTLADTQIYLTSADTQDYLTSADTQDFLTTADTQSFITSADTQNFLTSADTQNFVDAATYEEDAEVISTALNDLNERMDNVNSSVLMSVGELNSEVGIGDIQTKTAPSGDKIIFWNLEGSEGAELTIHSIPETWTDKTEHRIGQIRDKQVLGYGDDNWVSLFAYYNTTTNEPMIRVATEHSIEEYTLNEFGTSSEGNTLATFIDPENTAHTCTIIVLEQAGIYVITVNTDEGYDPNIIYDTDEYYDGVVFDGVYAKTSVSGYTKLATVEDIPDTSAFLTSADITTTITSASTDTEIASAKAVYTELGNIETLLSQI